MNTAPPTPSARDLAAAGLPDAVLWDMDGTIVDSEPYWIEAEYAITAEHGTDWDDERAAHLVGKDLRYSAAYLREHGGVRLEPQDIIDRMQSSVVRRMRERMPWRDGARELLAELVHLGVPQALVTMSWSDAAVALAEALPPGTFGCVVTGDRVANGKPHPEPYLLAMAELGVAPGRAVAIEDSPTGLAAAAASGAHVIAVPHLVEIDPARYRVEPSLVGLRPEVLLRS